MTQQEWEILDFVQAGMLARYKNWRAGQALFNALALVKPELAEEIRATELDPFHDNQKIQACLQWLKSKMEG